MTGPSATQAPQQALGPLYPASRSCSPGVKGEGRGHSQYTTAAVTHSPSLPPCIRHRPGRTAPQTEARKASRSWDQADSRAPAPHENRKSKQRTSLHPAAPPVGTHWRGAPAPRSAALREHLAPRAPKGYIFCFSSLYSTSTSWMTFLCRNLLSSWISLKTEDGGVSQAPWPGSAASPQEPCRGQHRSEQLRTGAASPGHVPEPSNTTRPRTRILTEDAQRPQRRPREDSRRARGSWGSSQVPASPHPLFPLELKPRLPAALRAAPRGLPAGAGGGGGGGQLRRRLNSHQLTQHLQSGHVPGRTESTATRSHVLMAALSTGAQGRIQLQCPSTHGNITQP